MQSDWTEIIAGCLDDVAELERQLAEAERDVQTWRNRLNREREHLSRLMREHPESVEKAVAHD